MLWVLITFIQNPKSVILLRFAHVFSNIDLVLRYAQCGPKYTLLLL